MRQIQLPLTLAGAAVLAVSAPVAAQCTTLDFEDYAPGTLITDQYEDLGVTFYAHPGSCGGPGTVMPMIVEPEDGTSSGTRALGIQTGCPDFSPDHLRALFDPPQRLVTFTVGEEAGPYSFQIGGWDVNWDPIPTQFIETGEGVRTLVTIGSPDGAPIIRLIYIKATPFELFECLDDFSFNHDPTPPVARIDAPVHSDCLCDVDGTHDVDIRGIACDYDGEYGRDTLEYRRVNANPGDPWIEIGTYTSPVCESGHLYYWNLNEVTTDWYFLRLTVENACGLTSTDIVSVKVDKEFGTLQVTSPADDEEVCGRVTFKGSAHEWCYFCFESYTVEYKYDGVYYPVDPDHPVYEDIVINGELAVWDTNALNLPDGTYPIRIVGTDECDNHETLYLTLHLNNTDGCGCPADIDEDGDVDTADLLALLAAWGICP